MTATMRRIVESDNIESIIQWLEDEMTEGENGILVYPNSSTFREVYMQYAKTQLVEKADNQEEKEKGGNDDKNTAATRNEQLLTEPRILLIATFYDTVNSVKHNLSAVGVNVQSHIDDGSLLIVDAFNAYYPDIDGMKKLVLSLSERAVKEKRAGVSVIINTGFFFLYGRDTDNSNLISYETSLAPKTDGGNVKSFNCYHVKNYRKFNDSQKRELLAQGHKKLLEVIEGATTV